MTHITSYEELFAEGVLEEGKSLNDTKQIHSLNVEEDVIQAVVKDDRDYSVEIRHENGYIKEMSCSCNFDSGHCKHLAAVTNLFSSAFIDPDKMDEEDQRMIELLHESEKEDLIGLIRQLAGMNDQNKRVILDYLDTPLDPWDDDEDWERDEILSQRIALIERMVTELETFLQEGRYAELFYVATNVFKEIDFEEMKSIGLGEESSALSNQIFDILRRSLQQSDVDPKGEELLWENFMELLKRGFIQSTSITFDAWKLMASMTDGPERLAQLKKLIESNMPKDKSLSPVLYREVHVQTILEAMEGVTSPEEQWEYMETHRDVPGIRYIMAKELLKEEGYQQAVELLNEGMAEADQRDHYTEWADLKQMLLKLALKADVKEDIRKESKSLLDEGMYFPDDFEQYRDRATEEQYEMIEKGVEEHLTHSDDE